MERTPVVITTGHHAKEFSIMGCNKILSESCMAHDLRLNRCIGGSASFCVLAHILKTVKWLVRFCMHTPKLTPFFEQWTKYCSSLCWRSFQCVPPNVKSLCVNPLSQYRSCKTVREHQKSGPCYNTSFTIQKLLLLCVLCPEASQSHNQVNNCTMSFIW